MKKTKQLNKQKLELKSQTIFVLTNEEASQVVGASGVTCYSCTNGTTCITKSYDNNAIC